MTKCGGYVDYEEVDGVRRRVNTTESWPSAPTVLIPRRIRDLTARRRAPLLIVESLLPLTPERAATLRRQLTRGNGPARVIIHGPDVRITVDR